MIAPIHKKLNIKDDYRMIVISDIHGHLDRFKQLLYKVNYQPDRDYLVILGDFVEKGDQVLDTIHFVKELDKNDKVFVLAGNCEWALCAMLETPELAVHIEDYLSRVSTNGLIRDAYHKYNLYSDEYNVIAKQKIVYDLYKNEIKYMSHLPVSLKVNDQFLLVHAGIDQKDYKNSTLSALLETQHFVEMGNPLNIPVIVGHLPTSNYRDTIDNSILFDYKQKIIAIDGGTGVKPISQLNALIIESRDQRLSYYSCSVGEYPTCQTIVGYVAKDNHSLKISYPNYEVKVIEEGKSFSKCIRVVDKQELLIKNEFLYQKKNKTYCLDDYTSHQLSFSNNENVSIIGVYNDYIYGMIEKAVGWIKVEHTNYNQKG